MNILMPQLGETVAEGKITKWFKSAGDAVQPGDNLFEIETDKVSMEVPATEAGVLSEIRVSEGEVVPVGAIVAVIGGSGAAASSPKPAPAAAEAPKTPCRRLQHRQRPRRQRRLRLRRSNRSSSIRFSRYARRRATLDRRGFPAVLPSRRWRVGSPPKPASISHGCAAPGRMAASSRTMWKARRGRQHTLLS